MIPRFSLVSKRQQFRKNSPQAHTLIPLPQFAALKTSKFLLGAIASVRNGGGHAEVDHHKHTSGHYVKPVGTHPLYEVPVNPDVKVPSYSLEWQEGKVYEYDEEKLQYPLLWEAQRANHGPTGNYFPNRWHDIVRGYATLFSFIAILVIAGWFSGQSNENRRQSGLFFQNGSSKSAGRPYTHYVDPELNKDLYEKALKMSKID